MNGVIDGLSFDEASHTYRMYGEEVPSVTQILRPLSNFDAVPADVLEAASNFGNATHKVCELHDLGTLDMGTVDAPLIPYLNAWKRFCFDHKVDWEGIEERVYHQALRFAGTLDRRGSLRYPANDVGQRHKGIIDIKTSAELYPSCGPQLAAYDAAVYEGFPYGARGIRIAVQLKADGTYVAKQYKDKTDWPMFASLVTARNWCAKHGVTLNYQQQEK